MAFGQLNAANYLAGSQGIGSHVATGLLGRLGGCRNRQTKDTMKKNEYSVTLSTEGNYVRSSIFNAESIEDAKETARWAWKVPSHELAVGTYVLIARRIAAMNGKRP
jgi:hypothetical protein